MATHETDLWNLEARGQFHEQIQTDPRFTQPFTYASLRGERPGCINDLVFGELEFDRL